MKIFNNIKESIIQFYKDNDKPTIIFGIIVVWPLFGFLPSMPQFVNYISLILYAFYCIAGARRFKLLYLLFLFYIPLNLLITHPLAIFRCWERYIIFALVLLCFSPLLSSFIIDKRHITILKILIIASVIISVGSFFARFIGINYMRYTMEDYLNKVGRFGGLTTHSIILGIISGMGTIFLTFKAITTKKHIYWIFAFFSLGSILFSESRSALLATLIGVCILIFKIVNTRKSISLFLSIFISLSIIISFWPSALNGIIKKNRGNIENIDLSSRQNKWNARISEFKQDPVFGVGFASVDPKNTNEYNANTGGVEPGSSWLAVLSMTGIVGALFIILIFYKAIKNLLKLNSPSEMLLLSLLLLFMIHMIAEGYIFHGGGTLCKSLWLLLGCCSIKHHENKLFNSNTIKYF